MSKIAFNVVLLPDDVMMDTCIEINQQIERPAGPTHVLIKTDCIPHITLAMGVMDEADISKAKPLLKKTASKYLPLQLSTIDLDYGMTPNDEKSHGFKIELTDKLQSLHNDIMDALKPYVTYHATLDMIAQPLEPNPITLHWINTYQKNSYDTYSSHITLGIGELPSPKNLAPIHFTAPTLALTHLGNYCTVRKILKEWSNPLSGPTAKYR